MAAMLQVEKSPPDGSTRRAPDPMAGDDPRLKLFD
jgi:hypothetical protein